MTLQSFPQFVPQEVCLKCDGCCRFEHGKSVWRPKVSRNEDVDQKYLDSKGYVTIKMIAQTCECVHFNNQDNTCDVYAKRPFECGIYPILLTRTDESIDVSVHLSCPYVQEHYGSLIFDEYVIRVKEFFKQNNSEEFINQNIFLARNYLAQADEIQFLFNLHKC